MSARRAPTDLYWPGDSPAHRLAVGWKLLLLAIVSVALFQTDRLAVPVATALAVVVMVRTAGVPGKVLWRAGLPVVVTVALVIGIQLLFGDGYRGLVAGTRLLALGALGVAFTLTTRVTEVVAAVERVLRVLRVREDRIFRMGLLVGITGRSVEYLAMSGQRVLDARRSRGLRRHVRAFAIPLVVEAGRFAHGIGDALDARGVSAPEPVGTGQATDEGPYIVVRHVEVDGDTAHARWTPTGQELGPADRYPAAVPGTLLVEAGAQAAGRLLAHQRPATRWLLAGVDNFTTWPVPWGTPLDIHCTVERQVGGTYRCLVTVSGAGATVGHGAVLMAPLLRATVSQ